MPNASANITDNVTDYAALDAVAKPSRWSSQQASALLLSAPAIVLMVLILLVPIVVAIVLSFSNYTLGGSLEWVGFDNYERIFTRSSYQKMLTATLSYVLIVVPISTALGLGAALLINSLRFAKDIYKTIYFLPVMASLLAMAIVWEFTLHPTIGFVNDTLQQGCDSRFWYPFLSGQWYGGDAATSWYGKACADHFPLWFGDKRYAIWTISFIGIWQAFGFNMVLYLAGLTAVPRELYNAAEMDGATSAWSRFRLVTWPMLGPTTVFVVTITMIKAFQIFDTVEAITRGGPAKSTYVMLYAVFEKSVQQNLVGMGSAITVLFLIAVMVLTVAQRWFVDRKVHYV